MALKIPKSFSYKGSTWRVDYVKNLEDDDGGKCYGICDTDKRLISLKKNLSPKKQLATFYHELYHVIVHEAHIPANAELTETVEDILAEAFSSLISTLFKLDVK